jgi:hypothetical protein
MIGRAVFLFVFAFAIGFGAELVITAWRSTACDCVDRQVAGGAVLR